MVERNPDDLNHTKKPLDSWKEDQAYYFPYSKDKYNFGSGLITENVDKDFSSLSSESQAEVKSSSNDTAKKDFCTVIILKISPEKLKEGFPLKAGDDSCSNTTDLQTLNGSSISKNRIIFYNIFQKLKSLNDISGHTPINDSNVDNSNQDGSKNFSNDLNNDVNVKTEKNTTKSSATTTIITQSEYQGYILERYDTDILKQFYLSSSNS